MTKLGFTFYPKDWWTSDTFFEFDARERYVYLELLFMMYQNDGYVNLSKEKVEQRLRMTIPYEVWSKITQQLNLTDLGYTHPSVKKRTLKAITSRENGKKGGRPKKPNNPTLNLPLEKKEKENNKSKPKKEIYIPSKKEFMLYAKSKIPEDKFKTISIKLALRFDSYFENSWKDARGTPIKNWKNKCNNAIISLLK